MAPAGRPRDGYGGVSRREKRRGNEGAWRVLYYDAEGRRREQSAATKAEALKIFRQRTGEAAQGKLAPRRERTLSLARYLLDVYLPAHGHQADYAGKKRKAQQWVKSSLANRPLNQIRASEVMAVLAGWRKRGNRPATINRKLSLLKHAYAFAVADGLLGVGEDAPRNVASLAEQNVRVRFLSADEEAALFGALPEKYHHLVHLALNTGLRQAEQWRIRAEDVLLEARSLRVPVSKGGRPRDIPLNKASQEILVGLLRDVPPPGYLLPRDTHGRQTGHYSEYSATNFYRRVFRPAASAAGLQNFVWHDLRHTFATRFLRAGGSLIELQRILGHANIDTTMRYAHVVQEHLVDVMDRLGGQK